MKLSEERKLWLREQLSQADYCHLGGWAPAQDWDVQQDLIDALDDIASLEALSAARQAKLEVERDTYKQALIDTLPECWIEALGIDITTQDTIDRLDQQNTRIAELEAALSACLADVEWLNADDVRELIVEATLIGKTGHLKAEKEKLPEIEEGE